MPKRASAGPAKGAKATNGHAVLGTLTLPGRDFDITGMLEALQTPFDPALIRWRANEFKYITGRRVIRPNLGSALRPKTSGPRKHFLTVDLTKEEHQQVLQHCLSHGVSLSQFFADLVLADATEKPERRQKVRVRFEFDLTSDEFDKLEMLARVHGKSDLNELVRDLLMPNIELERLHSPMDPITVRYYLSKEEHDIVTRHVASKGFSACNYAAMLTRKAIFQNKKRK